MSLLQHTDVCRVLSSVNAINAVFRYARSTKQALILQMKNNLDEKDSQSESLTI